MGKVSEYASRVLWCPLVQQRQIWTMPALDSWEFGDDVLPALTA